MGNKLLVNIIRRETGASENPRYWAGNKVLVKILGGKQTASKHY